MDEARRAQNRRQLLCWRALASALSEDGAPEPIERLARAIAAERDVPPLVLDSRPSVDDLLRRHPDLGHDFDHLQALFRRSRAEEETPEEETPEEDSPETGGEAEAPEPPQSPALNAAQRERMMLLYGKMLSNVFGAGMGKATISAAAFQQWRRDVGRLESALGYPRGGLHGGPSMSGGGYSPRATDTTASGGAPEVQDEDLRYALDEMKAGRGLMSEPEIKNSLASVEKNLINRMALREVLKDKALAEKLTPSMALVEELLRDKGNLSGVALDNAKKLIRRFVDELGELLKREVKSATKPKVDPRVPPKRSFRNLDLKRTVDKNLIHWDPEQRQLMVQRLYYRRGSARTQNTRLIVVVDQSGSMLSAMVNCTILASIFAALPKVDGHLIAFDTKVLDLTPWIHDPFEVLLRTNLGGGNDGPQAMLVAQSKIVDPRNTVMVWISDFYEFSNDQPLFAMMKATVAAGVSFIPVGSVSSSGYFNLNPYFRDQFKQHNIPLLSGSLKSLVRELRAALP